MISEPVDLEDIKVFRTPSVKGKKRVKIEMIDPAITVSTNN